MSQKKKQTFLEYYMMMEVPMGFSFGGPTIDKGIDKGVEAASKGIQKYMRRIDLNSMKDNWHEVEEDVFDDLLGELRSDAQGDKVLVKDVYKVQTQGMKDAWVKFFPSVMATTKSGSAPKDSKNRTDQAGEPTEITAFLTQPPNRLLKKAQTKVGLGASMGGKIVFVITVDGNEAEHFYIGAEPKAVTSIDGITKLKLETVLKNKSFGKILAGRRGAGGGAGGGKSGWVMYVSPEFTQKSYDNSMNILRNELSKFKPEGFDASKIHIIEHKEKEGPYSGGDSGWMITSKDPKFPNTEIAVMGHKTVTDEGDPKFNILVYGRGIFSQKKYIDSIFEIIKVRMDQTKVGKTALSNPFGAVSAADANMPDAEQKIDPNAGYIWEYEDGDVDGDFTKLSEAKDAQSLKAVSDKLSNKDLSTIIKSLTSAVKGQMAYIVTVVDDKAVIIKTKNNQVLAFGKIEGNDNVLAKCVITSHGYSIMTQPDNPEAGNLKALTFKKETIKPTP